MSHVSLPCRDLEESKIFYAQVMGGELVHKIPGFVEYRIEDIIVGLSEQPEGWTATGDEYPHYAFYISGENFELMKNWLDRYGVPNYPYRRNDTALMYFRDPSGNLFELYCDTGYGEIESLPLAPRRGGPPIDFRSLNYHWSGQSAAPGAGKEMSRPRFNAFAHASLFCRDLAQAKRFFTKVIGGELVHDVDGFAEVRVAGIIIGMTERPGRPTGRDAEYPHYAFFRGFSADGRVAPPERCHDHRAVDPRRHQGFIVLSRPHGKSFRDVLSKAHTGRCLCSRCQTGRQLRHRFCRLEL
jgi:catechol 2,3-dioxygenase-like lactoylglutathione lyase family enzyme